MAAEDASKQKFKFSWEINAGQVMTAIAFIGPAFMWWGNFNAEMAGIKQGQAVQADTNRQIRSEIREVKEEQKVQGQVLDGIKEKINRARL